MHARRLERHGDLDFDATKSARWRRDRRPRCKNDWCAGKAARDRDECTRCHRARHRGLDPEKLWRKYRHLCCVRWCWRPCAAKDLCMHHYNRLRWYGHVRGLPGGELEPIPTHCTEPGCGDAMLACGLCLLHLTGKSEKNLLLREFLPPDFCAPWHRSKRCIGKPGCKRMKVLINRCPDCLYDWQVTQVPPKRYLR
jgi:hypothetical protein